MGHNNPFVFTAQGEGSSSYVKTLECCVRDSMRMREGLHRREYRKRLETSSLPTNDGICRHVRN